MPNTKEPRAAPGDLIEVTLPTKVPCHWHPNTTAAYDARTVGGPWAYMCHWCFVHYALYLELGTGKGQRIRYHA
jgi:hypothetical protein